MVELRWDSKLVGGGAGDWRAVGLERASRDHRLLAQLSLAERESNLGQAARLTASLGRRALRAGQYTTALHWTEWSLHLLRAAGVSALGEVWPALQLRFTLKLLLGILSAEDTLIPRWVPETPEAGWFEKFLKVHFLVASRQVQEALAVANHCWTEVTRRSWLVYFVNPYIRLLTAAGEGIEGQQVARHMLTLTDGLPRAHRHHGLLNCGLALSGTNPEQAATFLRKALPGLPAPWEMQASLLLVSALRKEGQDTEAGQIIRSLHPQLREAVPDGLAALGFPFDASVHGLFSAAQTLGLHLQFLGRMQATWNGQPLRMRLRFAELLIVLSSHPEGLSNEQLTLAIYGDERDPACCKTELSRLKRLLPLQSRPYRLDFPLRADFLEVPELLRSGQLQQALELYRGPLLPASDAPEVRALREELEEGVRSAVLEQGDFETLWMLGSRLRHDLTVWEALAARLPNRDPRRGMTLAHVHSLQAALRVRQLGGASLSPARAHGRLLMNGV